MEMNKALWKDGYRDPVEGATVSFLPSLWGHDAARVARLYYQLALTYWLTASEISRMAQIAAFGVDPLVDEFDDPLTELEQRIEQAREDQERLRQLRQQGGSLEEIVGVMERTHEGLRCRCGLTPPTLMRLQQRSKQVRSALGGWCGTTTAQCASNE